MSFSSLPKHRYHICTCMHAQMHTRTHTCMHAHTHAHTHTHTLSLIFLSLSHTLSVPHFVFVFVFLSLTVLPSLCLHCSHIVSLTVSVCLSPLHFLLCTDFKGLRVSPSIFRFFGGRSMLGTGLSMLLSAGAFFFFAVTGTWGMLFNIIFLFLAGAFNAGPDSILGEWVYGWLNVSASVQLVRCLPCAHAVVKERWSSVRGLCSLENKVDHLLCCLLVLTGLV